MASNMNEDEQAIKISELAYCYEVEKTFGSQSQTFKNFLLIMKNYTLEANLGRHDPVQLVRHIRDLFKDHPELIEKFMGMGSEEEIQIWEQANKQNDPDTIPSSSTNTVNETKEDNHTS